jgi:hypothetical protein
MVFIIERAAPAEPGQFAVEVRWGSTISWLSAASDAELAGRIGDLVLAALGSAPGARARITPAPG